MAFLACSVRSDNQTFSGIDASDLASGGDDPSPQAIKVKLCS